MTVKEIEDTTKGAFGRGEQGRHIYQGKVKKNGEGGRRAHSKAKLGGVACRLIQQWSSGRRRQVKRGGGSREVAGQYISHSLTC